MEGFAVNIHAFDIKYDEKGMISCFIVHIGKIDLRIRAAENKEADKRTSTALLVWLAKNAEEIATLLKRYESKYEGKIDLNIFPLSGFANTVGNIFPYGGLTLEEFKREVIANGVKIVLGPNEICFVVRDDLENEYAKKTNSMEQMVFALTIYGLLLLVCGLNEKTATTVSRDFSVAKIPLTPKIYTHALALALISAKRMKERG